MAASVSLMESLVLSRVHDAVLHLDGDYRVLAANQRFFTWTAYSAEEVVGRDVADLWEERVRWTDWLTVLRLAGAARDSETLELTTRAGDPIPVEVHLVADPSIRSPKSGCLLVLHDLRPLRMLELLVRQDPLTGVSSRSALLPRLEEELVRAGKYRTPLGIILADIDGFGALNTRWGPAFGDEVLRVAGAELRERIRAPRLAGRWGSDEFLVLLPQAGPEEASRVATDLGHGLGGRLFTPQGVVVPVTVSFGVTVALPTGHDSASTVLARVTAALDRVRGRGGVEFTS